MKLKTEKSLENVVLVITAIVVVFSLVSLILTTNIQLFSSQNIKVPANIQIIRILYPECTPCSDFSEIIDVILQENVNITSDRSVYLGSGDSSQLIAEYNIQAVPALIITGEIDEPSLSSLLEGLGGTTENGTFIYSISTPPYFNVSLGRMIGDVGIVVLGDSSCEECFDILNFVDYLQTLVYSSNITAVEYNSSEGTELILHYNISRIPAVILSELGLYPNIANAWLSVGTAEDDGSYVLRATPPPYIEPTSGEKKGLVSVVYITDQSCEECYDVSSHRDILDAFGVYIHNETTYDVGSEEGTELVSKYTLVSVPTVIISPEVSVYEQLASVWTQVGTVEDDGYYVFRNLDVLHVVYKNLTSNTTVGS